MGLMALPQITWQDVQQMPDDTNRYEAIEGDLYVTAAPSRRHQEVSANLFEALRRLLHHAGHGIVYFAPIGVEFAATGEGVQPDLVFVSNARRGILASEGLAGAPDLVVEILSPNTATRDRGIKLRLYERQGVVEYWIVDPLANSIDVWRFDALPRHERTSETLDVRIGGDVVGEIDLGEIFAAE